MIDDPLFIWYMIILWRRNEVKIKDKKCIICSNQIIDSPLCNFHSRVFENYFKHAEELDYRLYFIVENMKPTSFEDFKRKALLAKLDL